MASQSNDPSVPGAQGTAPLSGPAPGSEVHAAAMRATFAAVPALTVAEIAALRHPSDQLPPGVSREAFTSPLFVEDVLKAAPVEAQRVSLYDSAFGARALAHCIYEVLALPERQASTQCLGNRISQKPKGLLTQAFRGLQNWCYGVGIRSRPTGFDDPQVIDSVREFVTALKTIPGVEFVCFHRETPTVMMRIDGQERNFLITEMIGTSFRGSTTIREDLATMIAGYRRHTAAQLSGIASVDQTLQLTPVLRTNEWLLRTNEQLQRRHNRNPEFDLVHERRGNLVEVYAVFNGESSLRYVNNACAQSWCLPPSKISALAHRNAKSPSAHLELWPDRNPSEPIGAFIGGSTFLNDQLLSDPTLEGCQLALPSRNIVLALQPDGDRKQFALLAKLIYEESLFPLSPTVFQPIRGGSGRRLLRAT